MASGCSSLLGLGDDANTVAVLDPGVDLRAQVRGVEAAEVLLDHEQEHPDQRRRSVTSSSNRCWRNPWISWRAKLSSVSQAGLASALSAGFFSSRAVSPFRCGHKARG